MSDSPEELLKKAELLAAAMERVGHAVWQVQALEDTLAHYVVVRVRGVERIKQDQADVLLASAQKRTMGALITELEKAGVVPDGLNERLRPVLEERNWLVHHARRETRGMLSKPEVYNTLQIRAEALMDESLALNKSLAAELESFVLTLGVSQEAIDTAAERLMKQWGI